MAPIMRGNYLTTIKERAQFILHINSQFRLGVTIFETSSVHALKLVVIQRLRYSSASQRRQHVCAGPSARTAQLSDVETSGSAGRLNRPTCQGPDGSRRRSAGAIARRSSTRSCYSSSPPRQRSTLTSTPFRLLLLIGAFLQRWPKHAAEHWLDCW